MNITFERRRPTRLNSPDYSAQLLKTLRRAGVVAVPFRPVGQSDNRPHQIDPALAIQSQEANLIDIPPRRVPPRSANDPRQATSPRNSFLRR